MEMELNLEGEAIVFKSSRLSDILASKKGLLILFVLNFRILCMWNNLQPCISMMRSYVRLELSWTHSRPKWGIQNPGGKKNVDKLTNLINVLTKTKYEVSTEWQSKLGISGRNFLALIVKLWILKKCYLLFLIYNNNNLQLHIF